MLLSKNNLLLCLTFSLLTAPVISFSLREQVHPCFWVLVFKRVPPIPRNATMMTTTASSAGTTTVSTAEETTAAPEPPPDADADAGGDVEGGDE